VCFLDGHVPVVGEALYDAQLAEADGTKERRGG
jgi:hypothetical protein